jgi:hypothetical protein
VTYAFRTRDNGGSACNVLLPGDFMGDMADAILDGVMDMEGLRLDYKTGMIDDCEAYDRGIIDEQGVYIGPGYGRDRSRKCRCCGKRGLLWGNVDGKFRLFENGSIHQCPVNPLTR